MPRNTKRLRLNFETVPIPPTGKKTCIICWGETEENSLEYVVFICDLDVEKVVSRIRIDHKCFNRAAICIVGSTLFVFEGFCLFFPDKKNLTVFKYELPSSPISDLKLERSMFKKAGELKDYKLAPIAKVLPDDKILVFATAIEYQPVWDPKTDFEIFDPVKGVSNELPNLCPSSSLVYALGRRDTIHVISYAIMGSFLLLKTDIGFFTLNLKAKTKGWQFDDLSGPFPGGQNIPTQSSSSFVVLGKEICIVSYYAFDIVQSRSSRKVNPFSRWFYKFPDLSIIPDEEFIYGGVTVLEDDFKMRDDIDLCFLKFGVNSDKHIIMKFDLYHLDVQECKQGLTAIRSKEGMKRELLLLPGVRKSRSFDYIDEAAKFGSMVFFHCSYIQEA